MYQSYRRGVPFPVEPGRSWGSLLFLLIFPVAVGGMREELARVLSTGRGCRKTTLAGTSVPLPNI